MQTPHAWHGIDLQWAYGGLLRAIVRQTRCDHRARDTLHDAFVRFASKPSLSEIAEPQAYFRRVVQSVMADRYRDSQRTPVLLGDGFDVGMQDAGATDAEAFAQGQFHPSEQDLFAIRQRLDLLQRLIDSLPPRCREVFWMFRVEGHHQSEIAKRLGMSLNMVERHVMRALVDLRAARDLLTT